MHIICSIYIEVKVIFFGLEGFFLKGFEVGPRFELRGPQALGPSDHSPANSDTQSCQIIIKMSNSSLSLVLFDTKWRKYTSFDLGVKFVSASFLWFTKIPF